MHTGGTDRAEKRLVAAVGLGVAPHRMGHMHDVMVLSYVILAADVERHLAVDEVNAVVRNDDLSVHQFQAA